MQISFIQSPCDRLLSPYLPKAFLLENPQEPTLQPLAMITGNRGKKERKKGMRLPPLYCGSVSAFQLMSETGNGGHMGHPPLQCNIQRDLT